MRDGMQTRFADDRVYTTLNDGTTVVSRTAVCTTGVEWRRLGLPDEDRYMGCGLFYGAATSEAPTCSDLEVFVVGGGNSAGQAVMNLSAYAKRVTMLVRGPSLSATLSAYLEERVVRQPNVEIRTNTRVAGLRGAQGLTSIRVEDTRTGAVRRNSVKRVASAVGEGAMAVTFVHSYLAST